MKSRRVTDPFLKPQIDVQKTSFRLEKIRGALGFSDTDNRLRSISFIRSRVCSDDSAAGRCHGANSKPSRHNIA